MHLDLQIYRFEAHVGWLMTKGRVKLTLLLFPCDNLQSFIQRQNWLFGGIAYFSILDSAAFVLSACVFTNLKTTIHRVVWDGPWILKALEQELSLTHVASTCGFICGVIFFIIKLAIWAGYSFFFLDILEFNSTVEFDPKLHDCICCTVLL